MLKKWLSITALLLLGIGLYAQPTGMSNEVIEGANGAKTTILRKASFCFPEFMSEDARYICGTYGAESGYAYDFEKDTCIVFLEHVLLGYIAPDHYVGYGFTHYQGTTGPFVNTPPYSGGAGAFAVQGNGERVVTMISETYTTASGSEKHMSRAAVHDGKTGQMLFALPYAWPVPIIDEDKLRFGARGDCISGDGAIIGGHSTNIEARSNWSLAFWDISDPNDIKVFGLGSGIGLNNNAFGFGSFYGANYDGSLIVGGSRSNGKGVIVHYDRTGKAISRIDTIAPLPSWDLLDFTAASDNGIVIGYCGMEFEPFTREPVIYTEKTGLLKLVDFLYEYYDIDVRKGVDFYTPMKISGNGRRIVGFSYEEDYPVPYVHDLSETRILPRARKISARAIRGEEKAAITWQAPLVSEHILTGYNIYRDDEETPLNGGTVLPNSQTYYNDDAVAPGKHTYYIEAVYADGFAMKQASNQIQVVGVGVAFPVQTISHRVDYNRFANIYWSVPSSEVAALAKNDIVTPGPEPKGQFESAVENLKVPAVEAVTVEPMNVLRPKSYMSTTLDYIANIDMLTYAGRAAVKVGEYYYVTSHLGGGIKVIDRFNEVVKTIYPEGLGIVVSMVYLEDKHQLYCGTSKGLLNVLDLVTEKIVQTYDIQATHLAYVPDMKDGQPGLVAGGAYNCNTYLWDEQKKDYVLERKDYLDFGALYAMGSAYYKGRLYVSSATGPYRNEVYVFDFETKAPIGEPIQVVEDPALYNLLTDNGNAVLMANLATSTMAGSLSVCELEDGTTALGMVFQLAYFTARFMLLELESAETVAGYDLYRSVNGGDYAKVNGTPMTSRRYAETIDKAGQYAYYVVVKSASGADDSEKSPVDTVVIAEQGTCPQPDFTVRESNRWAILEWMPGSSENMLIGFNVYRDDTPIARLWNNDMRLDYIDDAVSVPGTYTYRLEALYGDGCVAERTASITLTGQGEAEAPFGMAYAKKLNDDLATYNVTVTWETPFFEGPLALGFCNGVQGEAIGFDNFYECSGLIGWSGEDLDAYRDLYLVGMEYMVGATPDVYEALVYINDEQVYRQAVKQFAPREWRTVLFDKSFPMDQSQEVAVGFHTKYNAESVGVLAIDPTVTQNGKSNIVSLDGGEHWSTLQVGGLSGSWLINALVVRKRDLEAARNADGSINYSKLAGEKKLIGFNVYRKMADEAGMETKLNSGLLTAFELTDTAVEPGEYDYEVAAVYADGQEVRASVFVNLRPLANEDMDVTLSLNVYPNPATEWLNVEGEYETLRIFDLGGHLLRTEPAAAQIRLGSLKPGTYFLHFTGADARKAVYKIVVR